MSESKFPLHFEEYGCKFRLCSNGDVQRFEDGAWRTELFPAQYNVAIAVAAFRLGQNESEGAK